jgi:hypothetical protein
MVGQMRIPDFDRLTVYRSKTRCINLKGESECVSFLVSTFCGFADSIFYKYQIFYHSVVESHAQFSSSDVAARL